MPRRQNIGRIAMSLAPLALAACALPGGVSPSVEQVFELPPEQAPTYADLADLALTSSLVAVVVVDDQRRVPAELSPGLPAGMIRLYAEARMTTLLAAPGVVGESLRFVVDQPLDADGDPPNLERRSFLVFGDSVPGRPGELQLVSSQAMLPAGPVLTGRVRSVLREIAAADALPAITGLRDVISVPGNLSGESETQIFVETTSGQPVSLSVIRRPGQSPSWGVSLGEIVDQSARPPAPDSLAWYRFACFLPQRLPDDAFLQTALDDRNRAIADYAFVRQQLGPCTRRLG